MMEEEQLSHFTEDERGFLNRMSIPSKIVFVILTVLSLGVNFINVFCTLFLTKVILAAFSSYILAFAPKFL